jgi:2-polyprenyl-3-methyl-5-hydroxy-6-metoxy-1,4-benzoquinol methylase
MKNLYTELAEYTGRPQTLVEARCIHASVELAWQFDEDKRYPIRHYRESDLYMFALTRYQMELQVNGIHKWYQQLIQDFGWTKGLDYGGGIGEETILATLTWNKKVDMTFVEVDGSKTMDYAKWRFKKYHIEPRVMNEGFELINDYDFVVAMDVFEHMVNPKPLIENIAKHTKYLFCNPTMVKYNWLYPQHISQYSIEPYFKERELYFYERR